MHLKIAVVNVTGFFTILKSESGVYEGKGGVEYMLLRILSGVLNFTYELVQPPDNMWGTLGEDGSWSGMVGLLQKKEADMAINMINLSHERLQVSDYAFPYNIEYSTFVIKKAGMAKTTFYFAHPFQLPVWGCIVVFLLLSSIVLTFLQRLDLSRNRETYRLNLKNTFTAAETLIGNHDFGRLFNSFASRLFFGASALPFRILMFSFTGLLLSFLMKPIMEHQIKTIDELAEASLTEKIKVIVFKGSNLEFTFREADQGITKDLSKYIRNNPNGLDADIHKVFEKLAAGYALMESRIALSSTLYLKGMSDNFFISSDRFQFLLKAIIFKKNFCCIKDFDLVILRIHESGIYQKLLRDLFYKLDVKEKFQATSESILKPIETENLLGVFGLLFCGYALAMFAFLGEMLKGNSKKQKGPKKPQSLRLRSRNV